MTKALTALAAKAIESEVNLDFGQGSDYQAELFLSWDGGRFHANLVVYSEPHTTYGSWYDAPETTWREQEDSFSAVKIRAVADWLKAEWGFDLEVA